MSERRVRAVFTFPFLRCPTIVIEITDTRMICSDPIISRKYEIKNLIHVLVDSDIGVDKDATFVGGQLESSELGPCVLETVGYEGSFPVFW